MKTTLTRIHRRTLLRGAGVAMALPWLESIPVWGTEAATGGTVPAFPKRFAALFMGNGISPNNWWAKGAGREMELSTTPRAHGTVQDQAQRRSRACSTKTPPASAFIPARQATSSPERPCRRGPS